VKDGASELEEGVRRIRATPRGVFAAGFLFLLGAAAAATLSHFTASGVAPWLAVGYAGGAVVCTIAALLMRDRV
jgi:hypothetical protein